MAIDKAVRKSYRRGLPPSWFRRKRLDHYTKEARGAWAAFKATPRADDVAPVEPEPVAVTDLDSH